MTEIETAIGTGMKLTCSKEELVRGLAIVSRAVSPRVSVQVLGGVLVRAGEDQVELAASDMELSLRLGIDCKAEGEGAAVVPARLFVELARLLPEDEVHLEYKPDESVVELTCGSAGSRLYTYSADDFPELPAGYPAHTVLGDRGAVPVT